MQPGPDAGSPDGSVPGPIADGSVWGDASSGSVADSGSPAADGGGQAEPDADTSFDAGTADRDATTEDPEADGSTAADGATSGDDAGATGDAGSADAGPGEEFPSCTWDEYKPCGTYVLTGGDELKLGPYGAAGMKNVGKGFENSVSLLEGGTFCKSFGDQFSGSDPAAAERLMDISSLDLKLYTVYYPAKVVSGETYPVLAWGNGTCAQPEGYGPLLRYVASHGFIVVAANSRFVANGQPQKRAIDFAFAANKDPQSPLYQRVDTTRVGAMGHSQGSGGTKNAASDARVKAVIAFNGEYRMPKPVLAITGDRDILPDPAKTASGFGNSVVSNNSVAAWIFYHKIPDGDGQGHITLMAEPWRVTEPTTAWFKYQLLGDQLAREYFVKPVCKLCGHDADFEYGAGGLK